MKIILSVLLVLTAFSGIAQQSTKIIYDYDDGGNRIQRTLMFFRMADTTATEEFEEPPLADGNTFVQPVIVPYNGY